MAGLAASPEVCKGLATRLVVVGVSSSQGGAPDLLAVTGGPAFHDYPEIGDVIVEPASLHIVGGRFRWVEAQERYLIVGVGDDGDVVVIARTGVAPLDVYVEEGETVDAGYEGHGDWLGRRRCGR